MTYSLQVAFFWLPQCSHHGVLSLAPHHRMSLQFGGLGEPSRHMPQVSSFNAAISVCTYSADDCTDGSSMTANVISHNPAISMRDADDKGGLDLVANADAPGVVHDSAAPSACEKGAQWEPAICASELPRPPEACEKGGQCEQQQMHSAVAHDISSNAAISACEKGGKWEQQSQRARRVFSGSRFCRC